MEKLLFLIIAVLGSVSANACFLKGEKVSGMNKICFYDCVDGERAITIGATDLCPLNLSKGSQKQYFGQENNVSACSLLTMLDQSSKDEPKVECSVENGLEASSIGATNVLFDFI